MSDRKKPVAVPSIGERAVDNVSIQPWLLDHLRAGDQPYPGTPLDIDRHEIRILQLAGGGSYSPLCGELQTIALTADHTDRFMFDALSYTWGIRSRDESILVGDCRIPITDNLANALRRLRHWRDSRPLWIDAICIKQTDLDERAQQVRLMGDIYRGANSTLIWLGDLPNNLPSEWREAALFWQAASKNVALTAADGDYPEPEWVYKKFPAQAIEAAISSAEPHWHDRAWVLQEFVMSRNAILCFGSFTLQASRLRYSQRVRFASVAVHVDLGNMPLTKIFCERMSNFEYIAKHVRRFPSGMSNLSMFQAGQFALHLQCIDGRDKIYSLLSITRRQEGDMIRVDYGPTRTASAVFADATYASLVGSLGPLTLLAVQTFNPAQDTKPTWSINYQKSWDTAVPYGVDCAQRCQAPEWSQAIQPIQGYVLDHETLSLVVTGVPIDSVLESRELPMDRPFQVDTVNHHTWSHRALQVQGAHLAHDFMSRAWERRCSHPDQFKSAHGDFHWASESLPTDTTRPLDQLDCALFELLSAWHTWAGIDAKPPSRLQENLQLLKKMCIYAGYTDEAISTFLTTAGLLGIAPGVMEAGDLVVTLPLHESQAASTPGIIPGVNTISCNMPVVLRPRDGKYRFRGFAYVYGLFRGELTADWSDGHVPVRRFEIT